MIIGWRAWFVDVPEQGALQVYSSADTAYVDLPADGCLGFVFYEDENKPDGNPRRELRGACDYYFKSGDIYGSEVEVRERNVQDEIASRYVEPVIIRGIWTDNPTMKEAQEQMREAVSWPL